MGVYNSYIFCKRSFKEYCWFYSSKIHIISIINLCGHCTIFTYYLLKIRNSILFTTYVMKSRSWSIHIIQWNYNKEYRLKFLNDQVFTEFQTRKNLYTLNYPVRLILKILKLKDFKSEWRFRFEIWIVLYKRFDAFNLYSRVVFEKMIKNLKICVVKRTSGRLIWNKTLQYY